MPRSTHGRRSPEAGSAILITMLLVVSMLGGGAVLLNMQLHSSRSVAVVKQRISGQACAEAGLAAARGLVAANYSLWGPSLCNPPPPRGTGTCVIGSPTFEPVFLRSPAVDHDLDNDGTADFVLTLLDNDDEVAPATNNLAVDNDLQVYIVSTCIQNPENPIRVSELVRYTPGGTCYSTQLGGCGGAGNNK
jgi:hypothetical protein